MNHAWAWALGLALSIPLMEFLLSGDVGLSLQDEGFLWYGAQRVLAGEVPQRDFQAYDIARYYWSAAWMLIAGHDGVMALRLGHAVLGSICLVIATLLVRAGQQVSAPWALLVPITFWIWLAPYFKLSDSFAVLLLVAGLSGLLRSPSRWRWAGFGACLGFAGAVGINHGAYGTAAAALAMATLWRFDRPAVTPTAIGALVLGSAAGYLPVLAFHLLVPGFWSSFVDGIARLAESGATNIALPLPRPDALWRNTAPYFAHGLRESLLAGLAAAALALVVWSAYRLWRPTAALGRSECSPVFLASLLVALPYSHYFISRADVVHAAVSGLPFLVAAWTWPVQRWLTAHRIVIVGVLTSSAILVLPEHNGYQAWRGRALQVVVARGETFRVQPWQADQIFLVENVRKLHGKPGGSFYAAPYAPGAYALAGVRSPVWEIYALFPALPERQRQEIRRLHAAEVDFAILSLESVDGRADLGLVQTHRLIVAYLERCMRVAPLPFGEVPQVRVLVPVEPRCNGAS